jgi:hypothetical protein
MAKKTDLEQRVAALKLLVARMAIRFRNDLFDLETNLNGMAGDLRGVGLDVTDFQFGSDGRVLAKLGRDHFRLAARQGARPRHGLPLHLRRLRVRRVVAHQRQGRPGPRPSPRTGARLDDGVPSPLRTRLHGAAGADGRGQVVHVSKGLGNARQRVSTPTQLV